MLEVTQLGWFAARWRPTFLGQADFLYWPGAPESVLVERTGATTIAQIGNAVGTVRNLGARGGAQEGQTADANRGTLAQDIRRAVLGTSTVRYQQTFTLASVPTVYTVAAFRTPATASNFERIATMARPTIDDNAQLDTACLLLRNATSTSWGVFRSGSLRGSVTLPANTAGIVETIVGPTESRVSLNGGTDAVATYASLGDLSVSSLRALCAHETSGGFGSSSASTLYGLAVWFTSPTAEQRARARAEMAIIMGRAT